MPGNENQAYDMMVPEFINTKPTLLIIDDNKDILDFLADNLGEEYDIIKAYNGEDALALLSQESVQLIVSDVMMPVMDGLELCSNIKSNLEFSHIPVILLTAKNMLQSKIEGLELGADAYIEKPFSPRHLQVQIANLLDNRQKLREHFANTPLTSIKTMAHSKADKEFLEKLNGFIYKNLDNTQLDVTFLADAMNMSQPTLYRKIKALSSLSAHELINIARLKRAVELLNEGDHKIYRISRMVGYNSDEHLRRNFTKQFGMSPTEYVSKNNLP